MSTKRFNDICNLMKMIVKLKMQKITRQKGILLMRADLQERRKGHDTL